MSDFKEQFGVEEMYDEEHNCVYKEVINLDDDDEENANEGIKVKEEYEIDSNAIAIAVLPANGE